MYFLFHVYNNAKPMYASELLSSTAHLSVADCLLATSPRHRMPCIRNAWVPSAAARRPWDQAGFRFMNLRIILNTLVFLPQLAFPYCYPPEFRTCSEALCCRNQSQYGGLKFGGNSVARVLMYTFTKWYQPRVSYRSLSRVKIICHLEFRLLVPMSNQSPTNQPRSRLPHKPLPTPPIPAFESGSGPTPTIESNEKTRN